MGISEATRSREKHSSFESTATCSTQPFSEQNNSSFEREGDIVVASWEFGEAADSSRIFHHLAMESFRRRLSSIGLCMAKLPGSSNCGGPSLLAGRIDLLSSYMHPFLCC